jgi:hypothetical protein
MNENRERLVDLCEGYNLVIGGTHKEIHKYTWVSPNNRDKNQIDHIIVNTGYKRSLADVRGADAGTDLHLVVGKVKFRLSHHKTMKTHKQTAHNIALLKQCDILRKYMLELKNRFKVLEEEDTHDNNNIEEEWENFTRVCSETAASILGKKHRENKEWITYETWRAIDEKKRSKVK